MANQGSGTVSVIKISTNTVLKTVTVGGGPDAVAVTPNGSDAYVAGFGFGSSSGTVSVIKTSTNTVVGTVKVGLGPKSVAVTPSGDTAYVANADSNTVNVIKTSTTVVKTVEVDLTKSTHLC